MANSKDEAFEAAYGRLNTEQKKAVDTIEGPVMVIAGPGTGKTQILTLRIARILKETDTKPENILALTFTEAGAKAMRERLVRYIGAPAYRVPIYTFHGFAEQLIRNYPDAYTRVIGGRPASELEKIGIVETILEDTSYTLLRPSGDPAYYVRPILAAIGSMKQEYITPDVFAQIIAGQEKELDGIQKIHEKGAHKGKVRGEYTKKEKAVLKNKELLAVYRQYEALLSQKRLYDFEDMIVETVAALMRNEDMLRDLQETYQYIHADEHQDVNGSQNKILELLCSYHASPNIFVVGDEKQAIFRFQGASLENFLYFEDVFEGTKTISLIENYRSRQRILDASHSLIAVEDGPLSGLRVPLIAYKKEKATIEERNFSHQAVEDEWVVGGVESAISSGVPPEEIALIVRSNREVESFAELLRKRGISVAASADGDILSHPITIAVQALINAVIKSEDESALFTVLHGAYWGLTESDLVRILSGRSYATPLVSLLRDSEKLAALGVENTAAAARVMEVLDRARALEVSEAPHRVLEYVLNESGFLEHVIAESPLEGVRVVRRLYDEIEEMVRQDGVGTLSAVSAFFEKCRSYRLALNAPYINTNTHSVQVMTAHKSKGLEFEVVFVPHLVDNLWGGKQRRELFDIPLTKHLSASDFDALDDEKRLLYVAMTRAKSKLYLSHAQTNTEGKVLTPSRLCEELDPAQYEHVETAREEAAFSPLSGIVGAQHAYAIDPLLIKRLFLERGFSATHLNNYLKSPWDYFYRNLLRIPEVQPPHMQYGTAVHSVLEQVTRQHTAKGSLPTDSEIKMLLERALARLPFTKEEYVRRLEQGLTALYAYIPHIAATLPRQTKEEMNVRVVWQTGDAAIPEITLTGKLDRLDFDEEGNVLRVIDYKTGKPKTRGYIEGTTKDSNGDYKRQLTFYALLLSLYEDERYACREGVLSFVEPDAKGNIREETFSISDEEIALLKGEILRVAGEITSGAFLEVACDSGVSEYCALVEELQRRI